MTQTVLTSDHKMIADVLKSIRRSMRIWRTNWRNAPISP